MTQVRVVLEGQDHSLNTTMVGNHAANLLCHLTERKGSFALASKRHGTLITTRPIGDALIDGDEVELIPVERP